MNTFFYFLSAFGRASAGGFGVGIGRNRAGKITGKKEAVFYRFFGRFWVFASKIG
jgi:hypothetical protein